MLSKTQAKDIQSLRHKKFRDERGEFIAEGPKVVMELLEGRNFICKELFAIKNWMSAHSSLQEKCRGTVCTELEDFELDKISALSTPNQVLAVFEKRVQLQVPDCRGKVSLLLDSIQDPGNLGTIIRIADWFGISNIICSSGCADQYNPKVVQS